MVRRHQYGSSAAPDIPNPVHALPWADEALCAQADPELWFDNADHWRRTDGQRESLAKTICGRCPVKADCLAYAMADPSLEGIWGGLTARERMRIRKGRTA